MLAAWCHASPSHYLIGYARAGLTFFPFDTAVFFTGAADAFAFFLTAGSFPAGDFDAALLVFVSFFSAEASA